MKDEYGNTYDWQNAKRFPPNDEVSKCSNCSILHKAVRNRQPFALRIFLKAIEDRLLYISKIRIVYTLKTALHLAIRCDEADCVHYLVAAGADRSLQDYNGSTVAHQLSDTFNEENLYTFVRAGKAAIHLAVSRRKTTLFEALIEAGADVDQQTETEKMTPLHLAIEADNSEAVEMLVKVSSALPPLLSTQNYLCFTEDFATSIDYLTRLRLSRLLDNSDMWKRLATNLNCDHMVDFIQVCYEQDQSSPTMLLLDQYGMMENAALGHFLEALNNIGSPEIATILNSSWRLQQAHQTTTVPAHSGSN
ncbi:Death and Ank 2 domain containing protein [Trichuris trichiura]|uniref:Death and Ank 2 domain containing protein n=1 Tax=Trichuris trichiura TaxID=36087 RepID=A0A077Z1K8_TRITR|nr:Death and Ank 2 domain containing protein [Trichuris trichiura]